MDINLAQDKEKWWDIVNMAMKLQVPCNVENSLNYWRAVTSLKMDSVTLSYNKNSKKKKIMMKKTMSVKRHCIYGGYKHDSERNHQYCKI